MASPPSALRRRGSRAARAAHSSGRSIGVQWPQRGSTTTRVLRARCSRSAIARTACGGATPSSSPVTSSTGASMRSTAAGWRIGERLAAARIALAVLAHQALAHEGDGDRLALRACRPRSRRCSSASVISCMPAAPSPRAFAARARIAVRAASGGAISGPNSARLRTSLRRAPRRGAGRRSCPSNGRASARASMSRRAQTASTRRRRSAAIESAPSTALRAAAAGQVDADHAVAGQRRHQRRPGVGAAAQAVDADDGVALAFVLHRDAIDRVQGHRVAAHSKRFSIAPMPSISMRTTSPRGEPRGGSKPMPTPAGVPVAMTSPG